MAKLLTALLVAVFALTGAASAATLYVDGSAAPGGNGSSATPFRSIQAGINAAQNGDVVIVQPGIYLESIDFAGKDINLRSSDPASAAIIAATVISGSGTSTVVTMASGETAAAVLEGFTITDGLWSDQQLSGAGGIFIYNSSPTIRNNVITGNHSVSEGGGVAIIGDSAPLIQNNTISDNSCDGWGGGVVVYGEKNSAGTTISTAAPVLLANLIKGNFAFWDGGGVAFFEDCTGTIQNCVIVDNVAGEVGGGVFVGFDVQVSIVSNTIVYNSAEGSSIVEVGGTVERVGHGGGLATWFSGPTEVNSTIFWGNLANSQGDQISLEGDAQLTVAYSNVPGGQAGIFVEAHTPAPVLVYAAGNLSVDPLFASADDFHLRSTAGRFDPVTGTFVNDAVSSPLIDAGDPALSFNNEPSPNGGRRNMGAYGNTLQASRTQLTAPVLELTNARFDYAAGRMFFDLVMVDNGNLDHTIVGFYSGATISGAGAGSFNAFPGLYGNKTSAFMDDALAPDAYAWSGFGWRTMATGGGSFLGFGHTTDSFDQNVVLSDINSGAILARYVFYWDGSNIDELFATIAGYTSDTNLRMTQYDDGVISNLEPTMVNNGQNIVRLLSIDIDVPEWVYQNTENTTLDRHRIPVSVTILDDNENQNTSYVVTVIQTGGAGAVTFDPAPGDDPLVRNIIGGRRTDGTTGTGEVELNVIVTGNKGGMAQVPATIIVRKLGDIDGNGAVDGSDKSLMNDKLNGLNVGDVPTAAFDLHGRGGSPDGTDKSLLNDILNGVLIN